MRMGYAVTVIIEPSNAAHKQQAGAKAAYRRDIPVAIVNYTGDRDNWGCRATSRELVGLLQRALRSEGRIRPVYVPLLPRRPVVAAAHEAVRSC